MASLLVAAGLLWLVAARRVRARGPAAVSWRRSALFMAGLGTIVVALESPVDAGAATRFSVHMVQHLLIALVAAPLLVLARPVTLALQASTPATRRRLVLPLLHSRPLAVLTSPPVAWCGFALVMWATHFSPLYEAALTDPGLHALEHLAYLGSALLFWSVVAGVDPGPARLSPPARILYLFLAMPQMTFLGLAIYGARHVLYPAYGSGPAALADQRLAGALMGGSGVLVFIPAVGVLLLDWWAREERAAARADVRLDRGLGLGGDPS
jgi:cytochrome c oxidase assembly factor CtaG